MSPWSVNVRMRSLTENWCGPERERAVHARRMRAPVNGEIIRLENAREKLKS
jgi:hypothetical protein